MSYCMSVGDGIVATTKGDRIDVYKNLKHTLLTIPQEISRQIDEHISDVTISSNEKQLAVIMSPSKRLLVYDLLDTTTPTSFVLPRAASKIRFSKDGKSIMVADKTGDALKYSLQSQNEENIKLFGHLSLLLDILLTEDNKYVITCDRDEKIRVTHYPNTYSIKCYCLGHKEFVKNIELLPNCKSFLISTSGDGSIKLWDYLEGRLCHSIDTSLDVSDKDLKNKFVEAMDKEGVEVQALPIVHLTATSLNENCSLIAVTAFTHNAVLIYSARGYDGSFKHRLEQSLSLETFPNSIQFNNNHLWVYLSRPETILLSYELVHSGETFKFELSHKVPVFEGDEAASEVRGEEENIKVLYKRKFDNVQEYQERKRQRLEKKT